MRKSDAINKIQSLYKFGSRLGLERMEVLMELLGNPQDDLNVIHVAGTNGKGSTCRLVNSVLMNAGYKTGLFTSPFLLNFTERIEICGLEISEDELDLYSKIVFEKIEDMKSMGYDSPTEFEAVTAICFMYFKGNNVDFAIMEVGLGGRGDSTNVVKKPLVCAITSIGYDHMDRLGETLEKIAAEKAGILKRDRPVIININDEKAKEIVRKTCIEKNAELIDVSDLDFKIINSDLSGSKIEINSGAWQGDFNISLPGIYQAENVKVAFKILEYLAKQGAKICKDDIKEGFLKAKHEGRFEILKKNPFIIVDGAHNADGMQRLKESMDTYFPEKKILVMAGILKDKDVNAITDVMNMMADDFIITEPDNPRKLDCSILAASLKNEYNRVCTIKDYAKACDFGLKALKENEYDVFLICGSLYLIGKVREMIL